MASKGNQALETLHADHHPDSLKSKVGAWMHSKWVEIVIIILIFADMGLVAMEFGIDHEVYCIDPKRVNVPPGELVARAEGAEGAEEPAPGAHLLLPVLAVEQHPRWIQSALASAPVTGPVARAAFLSQENLAASHAGARARGLVHADVRAGGQLVTGSGGSPRSRAAAVHLAAHGPEEGGEETEGHGEAEGHGGHGHGHGGALICDHRKGETAEEIEYKCKIGSILILVIFEIELMIKIWINPSGFFSNRYHVLDLFVVSVSLFVDAVLFELAGHLGNWFSASTLQIFAAALVMSRVWRIVRIVHGIFEVMHAQKEEMDELEHEISEGKAQTERLQEKLRRLESRRG